MSAYHIPSKIRLIIHVTLSFSLTLMMIGCNQSSLLEESGIVSDSSTLTNGNSVIALSKTIDNPPDDLQEVLIKNPPVLQSFYLHDQYSSPFTHKQLEGKWTFLVFGYTSCPDICPTTLAEMDDFAQLWPKKEPFTKTQVVFISLDPKRDTDSELRQYLSYFNKDFIGATGEVKNLKEFCTPLGIDFSYEQITKDMYGVNHSSSVILIDPKVRYFARFSVPLYANDLLELYNKIINYHQSI